MLLYKYRPLGKIEYLLDILINQRLYCPEYKDLNDPFEGMFMQILPRRHAPGFLFRLPERAIPNEADKLFLDLKKTRVCSLSATSSDVRMWSLYGDDHKGTAIEIDFTDNLPDVHQVIYSEKLPEHGISLLTMPHTEEILSRKTVHWQYEAEYRHITHERYYSIEGRIRRVLVGPRAESEKVQLLQKAIGRSISFQKMRLDFNSISVVEDR